MPARDELGRIFECLVFEDAEDFGERRADHLGGDSVGWLDELNAMVFGFDAQIHQSPTPKTSFPQCETA